MSRDWRLYLDEAAFDAVLFNLQVIGESGKRLPPVRLKALPPEHRAGPARLRDLIAHRYFALDPEIIWEVATRHVPALLADAQRLQREADADDTGS